MNVYLMIAIIVANIIALGVVYQFIKKLPKKEIIVFMAISVALMYVSISIVYWMSGLGVEKEIHEGAKSIITYLFVPVNVILFIPYFASQYNKLKQKKIKKKQLQNKSIIVGILLLFVLIVEYFYFGKIQKNIVTISDETQKTNTIYQNETFEQNTIQNEIQNETQANQEVMENTEITNEI